MQYKDYYQVLGVSRSAGQDEIKRAYRKLARKYHPDVSKEAGAEDKFKEVSEAYEVLKDPEKRAAYDQLGSNWKAGQDFRPPPNWDANFEFSGGGFTQGDASAFSDFFEQMFGGARDDFNFGRNEFRQAPRDHHAKIVIDIEDSIKGSSRTITLQRPQLDSQGKVINKPHTLEVKIPRGICAGQQIRLKNQGADGSGGRKGDLYLEVSFRPHPLYRVDGRDLEMDLPITPWEAALGTTVRVPTPDGEVDLKIPAGSTTDQRLRLRGRGIPASSSNSAGNLTAILKIVTPPASTEKHKALYQKMRDELDFNPRQKLGAR